MTTREKIAILLIITIPQIAFYLTPAGNYAHLTANMVMASGLILWVIKWIEKE